VDGENYNFGVRAVSKQDFLASTPPPGAGGVAGATVTASTTFSPLTGPVVVTGAGAGGLPVVQAFDGAGNQQVMLFAYAATFTGGVNVALGDVNGDGYEDVITAPASAGGPHVKVFSGLTGALLGEFMAYAPTFGGGVRVAAADVNGDGKADIITGAGPGGGPHVKVFSGAGFGELASFMAYNSGFAGGVTVAAGDFTGDGKADIVTGAGAGGGPHVKVFDGQTLNVVRSYYAYAADFTGGVSVAVGDFDGNGAADIITGAGPGGGPQVKVFKGADPSNLLASFYAYDSSFLGGVRVAAADFTGDGRAEIITGPGSGGVAQVRLFGGLGTQFLASDPADLNGLFVAG
jgi:hypothetical protein